MNAAITTITDWFDNRWELVENVLSIGESVLKITNRLLALEGRVRDQNKLIVDLQEEVLRLSRLHKGDTDELNRVIDRLKRVEQRPTGVNYDEDFDIEVRRVVKEVVEDELRITVDFV